MENNDFCTIDQKLLIKEQIIQNLENYGVFWDRDNQKIIVDDPNDFREVQRKSSEVFSRTFRY
jgi:DNA phosphorothioation-dependent restriction protein DptG